MSQDKINSSDEILIFNPSLANATVGDDVSFLPNTTSNKDSSTVATELRVQLNKTKEEQGLIGKAWDGIKNLFGMKAGSNNVEKTIQKLENGKITQDEAQAALQKYQDGQKMCVDVVADMASGIVAVGAAMAAPVTGGASLLVAAGVGAGAKIAIKGADCAIGGREYKLKDIGYDLITGSINGAMAPLTNALGGAAGTGVAKACGLNFGKMVVKETGEEVFEQTVWQTGKSFLTNLLAKQGTEYVAKVGAKAGLKTTLATIAAYGTDMAIDGALGGATDGFARSLADGDFENMGENIKQGFTGGLIAAPLIGGGFRLAGKAGSKVGAKLFSKEISESGVKEVSEFAYKYADMPDEEIEKAVKETIKKSLPDYKTRKQTFLNLGGTDFEADMMAQESQYINWKWHSTNEYKEIELRKLLNNFNPEQMEEYTNASQILKEQGIEFHGYDLASDNKLISEVIEYPNLTDGTLVPQHHYAYAINNQLRNQIDEIDGTELNLKLKIMNKGFKNLPPLEQQETVYRGVGVYQGSYESAKKFLDTLYNSKSGDIVSDKGYAYSSFDENIAHKYSQQSLPGTKNAFLEIEVPEGAQVSYKNAGKQKEMLFPMNAQFEVIQCDVYSDTSAYLKLRYIVPSLKDTP